MKSSKTSDCVLIILGVISVIGTTYFGLEKHYELKDLEIQAAGAKYSACVERYQEDFREMCYKGDEK